MKNARRSRVVVLVVFVLVAGSCTTTQPDRITTRRASLGLVTKGLVDLYNCYERWQDINGDGLIDPAIDVFQGMRCDQAVNTTKSHRSVPWHYSLSVSLIRAGTTTEEIATSVSGVFGSSVQPGENPPVEDYISMTEYDPDAPPIGDLPPAGNIYFINGKRVSPGSPVYLSANGFFLGEPTIFGAPGVSGAAPTFDFDINSGDTVIVRARKQPFSLTEPFMPLNADSEVQLIAVLTVGGIPVSTIPTSPVSSTFDDGAGFTFSYTVQ